MECCVSLVAVNGWLTAAVTCLPVVQHVDLQPQFILPWLNQTVGSHGKMSLCRSVYMWDNHLMVSMHSYRNTSIW